MKEFWSAFKEEIKVRGVKVFFESVKEYGIPCFLGSAYGYIASQLGFNVLSILISGSFIFGSYFLLKNAYKNIRRGNEP